MTRMKESGIDWIGQIPEEWEVRPIKNIVETPVTDGPHETPMLYETGIPFLSAEAVKDGILDFNYKRGYISLRDHERFKKKVSPKKDDIFIVKSGATTGNVGIVNTDEIFDIWSPLALVRSKNTLAIQKYIYFYLLSTLFKAQVEFNWSFGTQQNIGMGVIERIKVILPPISEQERIVEILDKKTAQLDKAKALLEEQIQKLKDYRASLIYETVTKGLDKTVPMKDSGINWIGEVPEGWGVKRLKYLVNKIGSGKTPLGGSEIFEETGILFIRSQNVHNGLIQLEDKSTYINRNIHRQMIGTSVEKNDILLNITGASIGRVAKYDLDVEANVNQHVCIIRCDRFVLPDYLMYFIMSEFGQFMIKIHQISGNREGLSFDNIGNFKIIIPDLDYQYKISQYLNKKMLIINQMIKTKDQQIENINKQRQTLIYDYVTGKRRV